MLLSWVRAASLFHKGQQWKNTSLYLNRTLNVSGDLTCDSQTTIRIFSSVVLTDYFFFFFFPCNPLTNGSVIFVEVSSQGKPFVEGPLPSDNSTFEGHTSLVRQVFGSITVGPKRRAVLRKTCYWWTLVHIWNSPGRNNSHHSTLTWLSFQSSNVSFLEGQLWGDTTVKSSKMSSSKVYQVNMIL